MNGLARLEQVHFCWNLPAAVGNALCDVPHLLNPPSTLRIPAESVPYRNHTFSISESALDAAEKGTAADVKDRHRLEYL